MTLDGLFGGVLRPVSSDVEDHHGCLCTLTPLTQLALQLWRTEGKDAGCLLDCKARVKPVGTYSGQLVTGTLAFPGGASALLEGKEFGVEPNAHLGVSEGDREDIVRLSHFQIQQALKICFISGCHEPAGNVPGSNRQL